MPGQTMKFVRNSSTPLAVHEVRAPLQHLEPQSALPAEDHARVRRPSVHFRGFPTIVSGTNRADDDHTAQVSAAMAEAVALQEAIARQTEILKSVADRYRT